jgi:phage antirepressor YoqD-like protein
MAFEYNLPLAKKMGTAGANVYMLRLAGYKIAVEPELSLEEKMALMAESFLKVRGEKLALVAQIEADRPATELGKAIVKSEENIRIGDFAKVINVGPNKYFNELRECKIIMATSTLPYQQFLSEGYFVVTETVVNKKAYPVALVTPKGQAYLVKRHNKYLESRSTEEQMELALESAIV